MKKGKYLFTIDDDTLIIKQNKTYFITKNDNNYIVLQDKKYVYDNQLDVARKISASQKNRYDIVYIIKIYDNYLAAGKRQHGRFENLKVTI